MPPRRATSVHAKKTRDVKPSHRVLQPVLDAAALCAYDSRGSRIQPRSQGGGVGGWGGGGGLERGTGEGKAGGIIPQGWGWLILRFLRIEYVSLGRLAKYEL